MNGRLLKVMALGVITALITSLGWFAPASADPVLCNTNQPGSSIAPLTAEQCAQGWYREYHSYVDANGILVQGTIDWKASPEGLSFIMYHDFGQNSRLSIWTSSNVGLGYELPASGDLVVFLAEKQDGQIKYWGAKAVTSNMLIYGDNLAANKWWGVGGSFVAGGVSSSGGGQPGIVFAATAVGATKTCNDQGLVAKHVQKRLKKPRYWRCIPPPSVCKRVVALKQAGKTKLARKLTRRCAVTLRRWRR